MIRMDHPLKERDILLTFIGALGEIEQREAFGNKHPLLQGVVHPDLKQNPKHLGICSMFRADQGERAC
jgi:hypothetical protein